MPYASDRQRRFMHARHPGIARRWDQEEKTVSKQQPRYGAGTSGRRLVLDEPADVEKGLKDVGRVVSGRVVRPAAQTALRPVKRGVRRLDDAKASRQFGKRIYDPEHRRQRRIGMGEAALLATGGVLGYRGGRGVANTTRAARRAAKLTVGWNDKATHAALRHGVIANRKDLAQLGGGVVAVGGAGALRRHAESRSGRAYD